MRKRLIGVVSGVIIAVALCAPAAAQAAVKAPAKTAINSSAQAKASLPAPTAVNGSARPAANPPGDGACANMWDEGNGKYAGPGTYDGYYVTDFRTEAGWGGVGYVPYFCNESWPSINGAFQIFDDSTGLCVIPTFVGTTMVAGENSCGTDASDLWFATKVSTYHSQSVYEFENYDEYNGASICLYDDAQQPGTWVSPCGAADHFEWFVWDALS
jgi:hypothetical protein